MNQGKEIVMYDSEQAAVYESRTLTGWWTPKDARTGKPMFWGEDENMARYCGCTHKVCACGSIHSKAYTCCSGCRNKNMLERYHRLPETKWDGKTPLCLFDDDRYFYDEDDIFDFCEETKTDPMDLALVVCEPVFPCPIDAHDQWSDDLPEDGEIPDNILAAVEALNKALQANGPLSWRAGDCRTTVRLGD